MSFKSSEVNACHQEAVEVCVTLPASSVHIGEQLSTQFAEENHKMQIKILSCLQLLARQGLMKKFSFMFGVYLGDMILWHSDNLSKTLLQSNTICAAEGQNVAGMVVRTLEKLRSSEAFDLFWQKVADMQFRNPWCWRTRSASST